MKNKTTFIYCLIDPVEPDIIRYVGKSNNVSNRLYKHINESKKSNSYKNNWIKKLLSQGRRPEIKVLKEVNYKNWKYWEKFYIKKYKSDKLTNVSSGGDGGILDEKYEEISLKKWNRVAQIDIKTKKIIKIYLNISDAANYIKAKSRSRISDCCNGKCKTSMGFIWRFLDKKNKIIIPDNNKCFIGAKKRVAQINLITNEIIKIYNSQTEASKHLKIKDSSGISSCCKGLTKSTKGYSWRFVDDKNNIIKPKHKKYKKKYKIGQFDLNNNLISIYKNAKEAANKIGLKHGDCILLVCKGKNKTSKNYIWKFLDEENNIINQ